MRIAPNAITSPCATSRDPYERPRDAAVIVASGGRSTSIDRGSSSAARTKCRGLEQDTSHRVSSRQLPHRLMRRFSSLFLTLFLAAPLSAQKRGITAEDYFSFELVSDPRISPDGSNVVYVVSRVDRAQNRRVPSIWIAPTDGSAPAHVLIGEEWSPTSSSWAAPRWPSHTTPNG